MAALDLHHVIFTNERISDLPLRPASFLHPASERDESPANHLLASSAYQDLIQRQPTHPDGPMSGWDLGLNLLGDPMTAAEYKSLEDYQTKMKLRRLRAINFAFELLFGIWGIYTTIRYFLAFGGVSGDIDYHLCALILGIMSMLVVALVIVSIFMPLFPQQGHLDAWRHAKALLRAFYLLLLSAGAMTNLVLVSIRHPTRFCRWDIDVSWYTSAVNTAASPCHPASFAAWITAAILRLLVTWALASAFVYTLCSYHKTRHPTFERSGHKYSPYLPSDPEEMSPISPSSPLNVLKQFKRTHSQDSDRTLNQSNTTLPKYTSISTLALSTSCTGHSRSHSAPSRETSSPKISPPKSRRAASVQVTSHGPTTQVQSEMLSQTQPVVPHMLRRQGRISLAQVTFEARSHGSAGQLAPRDPSEIRSCTPQTGHRGPDVKHTMLAWEAHAGLGSPSSAPDADGGESIQETHRADDVCAYGYGAPGPTYPYLDMYNQAPGYTDASSSYEDVDELGVLHGHGHRASSPTHDAAEYSGEEEEYVAMMGGFVRRMATIESLGSREGSTPASTAGASARAGSVATRPTATRSWAGSPFSSVRFAAYGSPSPTSASTRSTAYLSFSSGGTTMGRVNERGERLGADLNAHTDARSDRHYYTASGKSVPTDEDR